jgi:pyruvate-formate lyase-activating enzyme
VHLCEVTLENGVSPVKYVRPLCSPLELCKWREDDEQVDSEVVDLLAQMDKEDQIEFERFLDMGSMKYFVHD